MKRRDIRKARKDAQRNQWNEARGTLDVEEQRLSDEAWRDAIAEANSRGRELEHLSYQEARKRK